MKSCASKPVGRSLAVLIALLLLLAACGRGPFTPEARRQAAELEGYQKVLQAAIVRDDTFEWNVLSSALIVSALPYTGAVRQEAESRFVQDPGFETETRAWTQGPRGRSGSPLVILMGVYAPDLSREDVTKLSRFRPRLVSSDGRVQAPLEIKRYGRDAVFIRDHFPVFNVWEEVFMVKFERAPHGRLDFRLEWPGGVQTLILNGQ